MFSLDHSDKPLRVALYARVSSEDQAERDTIEAQRSYLKARADLEGWHVHDLYEDNGISGTLLLGDRPHGRRMLADAEKGLFDRVVFMRVDRFGRTLEATVDGFRSLDKRGVAIQSTSESFDTATASGRMLFQILSSFAEYEKATISERLTRGRDRVSKDGRWTLGPVPFGYDLDGEQKLVPSLRLVGIAEQPEAELARSVFEGIIGGSSTIAEAARLNALGAHSPRRYANGSEVERSEWSPGRVHDLVSSSTYKGSHVIKSRHGAITREVPPLVDEATWTRANAQLKKNRILATKNAKHSYLLRGLVRCACGVGYVGITTRFDGGKEKAYYRCSATLVSLRGNKVDRCNAKQIAAGWLEELVWQDCRQYVLNPDDALAEAQRQLRERMERAATAGDQRQDMLGALAEKEQERERILTLFRKGKLAIGEAETQLDAIRAEATALQAAVDKLRSEEQLLAAYEARFVGAAALLRRLQDKVQEIEATDDWAVKRAVVEQLVSGVTVATEGTGRGKQATLQVDYVFGEPVQVETAPAPADDTSSSYANVKQQTQQLLVIGLSRMVGARREAVPA